MKDLPRIVMDFIGGSEDGARYGGGTAQVYYLSADHGRVGARLQVIPEYTFLHPTLKPSELSDAQIEIYEVEERHDDWDHIYIRARYIGREDAASLDEPNQSI